MKVSKKTTLFCGILATLFITLVYPQLGCMAANHYEQSFNITWLYIHHSVQLILAVATILVITILTKKDSFRWGFNLNKWKWSVKTASIFAIVWFIISLAINLIFNLQSQINYEPTANNIITDLIFDFILTGISEEVLFRGLIMGILLTTCKGELRIGSFRISIAGVITSVLFAIAHIGIDYESFTLNISTLQLVFAFGLGLFYAKMRDYTNSLLGPVIAHGASDGLITVIHLFM